MDDGFEVYFFGCYQRKSFLQIKTQLGSKNTFGASAGTVGFKRTGLIDMP